MDRERVRRESEERERQLREEPERTIEKRWEHAGLKCLVWKHPVFGNRNGYVQIPQDHPWWLREYWDGVDGRIQPTTDDGVFSMRLPDRKHPDFLDEGTLEGEVEVHGGLTFAGELPPEEGWWIGFDTMHAWDDVAPDDMAPSIREVRLELGHALTGGHVWTVDEVAAETERLADQVAAIRDKPAAPHKRRPSDSES